MAVRSIGDMVVRIIGDNAQFDGSIDKSEKKLNSFAKSAADIGGKLSTFVTLPLIGIGVAAVKSAADMEQAQLAFETLLGSGEKAKVLLAQLKDFAATTPFEFQDLANGAKQLLAFGVSAENILPITKQLGDVALGDSERFKSLALVFGQISSTGRLMGQDLLQLVNVGFNPLQEISKKTGESITDLKKRMEQGGVSAKEVEDAFKSATAEGGRFFQGTQKLGTSFTGLVSTLKDDAATLGRSFAEILLPTLKDVVKGLSGLLQGFANLDPGVKQFIVQNALFYAALGPTIGAVGKLTQAIQFLGKSPQLLALAAIFTGVSAAVAIFNEASKDAAQRSADMVNKLVSRKDATAGLVGQLQSLGQNETINKDLANKLIVAYPELAKGAGIYGKSVKDVNAELDKLNQKAALGALSPLIAQYEFLGRETNRATLELANLKKGAESYAKSGRKIPEENLRAQADAQKALEDYSARRTVLNAQAEEQAAKLGFKLDIVNKTVTKVDVSQISALGSAAGSASTQVDELAQSIKLQRDLSSGGFIDEKTALENIIKLRQDEISKLESSGRLTEDKKNKIKELTAANFDDQQSLFGIIDAEKKAADAGIAASDEIVAAKEAETQKRIELAQKIADAEKNALQETLQFASQLTSSISSLIKAVGDQQLAELDRQQQAALEAAGVAEDTKLESAQKQLEQAQATLAAETDATKIAADQQAVVEAEKAVKRAQIEEDFQKKKADLQYKYAHAAWVFQLLSSIASAAEGVVKGMAALPIPPFPFAIAAGILGAAQVAAVAAAEPKPIALAEGGVVMPRTGGVPSIIAEAGKPEAVIPLDRISEVVPKISGSSSSGDATHVTINIDSKTWLDKIFPATKNGTILIDARAVV